MTKTYFCFSISIIVIAVFICFSQDEVSGNVLGSYVVKSVKFEFIGKRSYKDKRLSKLLSFKKGDNVDAVLAGFGRDDIEQFYFKKGYAFVAVDLDITEISKGAVRYIIKEGSRVKVRSVKFSGNKSFKAKELRKAIKIDGKDWLFFKKKYSHDKITEDLERLEDFYYEEGFLDRKIYAAPHYNSKRTKAVITFEIHEGPVHVIENISISGGEELYRIRDSEIVDQESLLESLDLQVGGIYKNHEAQSDRNWIRDLFLEHGFIDAGVGLGLERVLTESAPGAAPVSEVRVNVDFSVSAGDQFRIGRIDITGNKQTQDKVIRRVLDSYDFSPGSNYNANLAKGDGTGDVEREIGMMALMQEVTVSPVASSDANQKNVEVMVKERQTGAWMLGAGISSDTGLIGSMVWEQRNFDINDFPESFGELITGEAFKGGGQSLKISLNPGLEQSYYTVNFTEPYFRDKPVSLNVSGSAWGRYQESYEENRTAGNVGFAQRYEWRTRDHWRKNIGFRVQNVEVEGIDFDAPGEIKDMQGDNVLTGITLGVGKDKTDNRFFPREGYRLEGSYEQVTGDHTFGVAGATLRHYLPVYVDLAENKTVLATKLHAATTIGDAPAFEKFYAGGTGATYGIRGFDYRGVSTRGLPQVNGVDQAGAERKDPIGSDWIFLASAELIVPLYGDSLSSLLFVDSGAIDSGPYRVSAGAGLQLMIPQWFGPVPMRFEFGFPLIKDEGDDTQLFSFSIAQLF
ncbi:MAG: outer membrane protein assembly factor BamA [Planctomycetota bacterium]|jgi:outer membrane protein insertion porin family